MYNIEVEERINKIMEIFCQVRMWRRNGEKFGVFHQFLSQFLWKSIYVIIVVFFSLSLTFGGFLVSADMNDSIFSIGTGIGVSITGVKLAYILWNKETIREVILEIGAHCIEDYEEFKQVDNKVKKLLKFAIGFTITMAVCCLSSIIFGLPVFSSQKRLPADFWFPFDWKNNTTAYYTAFAFVLFATTVCLFASLLNIIIWYLMMNCAIKYQILGNQFRNIGAKSTVEKRNISEAEKEKLLLQELIGLIKTHRNIQKVIDRFNCFFSNLFLAQLTTSAICICGSVYVLAFRSDDEEFIQIMIHVAMLSYYTFDIYLIMFLGNEIHLSSDRLSYCLFDCCWIERSQSYKRCVIILGEVFKQPNELVIGKLYPLNLETFTSIINTAYSMFNVLQNLH